MDIIRSFAVSNYLKMFFAVCAAYFLIAQQAYCEVSYSGTFYSKLRTCTLHSEKYASGDGVKILGKDNDRCVVLRIIGSKKYVCAFTATEIDNLVKAGMASSNSKKGWFNSGANIFSGSSETRIWNFYKYKCREID